MKDFWVSNEGVFLCLSDYVRTTALRKAIRLAVTPGDVVVDAGAGSGILSLFALDSGAKRVYAIENDPIGLKNLKKIAKQNDYKNRFMVINGDSCNCSLPE